MGEEGRILLKAWFVVWEERYTFDKDFHLLFLSF